jgi:FkbM family methyltransferase
MRRETRAIVAAADDPLTLILACPLERDAFYRTSGGIEERSKPSPNCSMKLADLPRVLRINLETVKLLGNWPAVVRVRRRSKAKTSRLQFRNGVVLQGQAPDVLEWLFHEVWVNRAYSPPGYEIQRGDTVIDVGANIGAFAMFAATRAPDVKVYSFEPVASNVAWLRKNVEDSGLSNVQVFQQAVAGSSGQRPLFIEPGNCMFHSLFCNQAIDGGKRGQEMVECTTLDEIFTAHRIKCCQVLKLDCEGAELEILESTSPETLKQVRKVVGEYHGSYKLDALRQFLESHSFHIDYCQSGIFRARNTSSLTP